MRQFDVEDAQAEAYSRLGVLGADADVNEQEATDEMADYEAGFGREPTDEEMERAFILNAQATPPEQRDRHQWAALGWAFGPPIYAREGE